LLFFSKFLANFELYTEKRIILKILSSQYENLPKTKNPDIDGHLET
jgi:hypothetical protein